MSPESIRSLRKEMGLEQVEFAARIGVTVFQISRWECGRQKPSPLALAALKSLQGTRKFQKAG